jgi:hypothetical protein
VIPKEFCNKLGRQGRELHCIEINLMKILAIEKEVDGTKSEDFKLHLPAEAERVWEINLT